MPLLQLFHEPTLVGGCSQGLVQRPEQSWHAGKVLNIELPFKNQGSKQGEAD
ncbi:hypothetical protein JCM9140_708 [Halalkalibacter wakoensis JCM 9140]|uniref:Uncharacterized protein n=1 Tax=Halalkalibacter wakoensis JCM 9140 TaxID=1236970 RepID=W4PY34_9BACI|nr:hypothetical protein JCM9140_708 [Halalkalibacter wakoensis JCM 9140]